MQNYFLEQSKLDSCRIQLPVRKVDVLGKIGDILSPTSTITGEQYTSEDDLIIPLHEDSIKNGIKFRVGKRTILKGNLPSEDVFEIGLSAKMLEAGYFEGINKFNVREVYEYIISTKIIRGALGSLVKKGVVTINTNDSGYDIIDLNTKYWYLVNEEWAEEAKMYL
jgi:hypothetical protein